MMRPPLRSLHAGLGVLLLTLVLGGCATADRMQRVPIAGGKFIEIPVGPTGPKPLPIDGFEAELAALMPGPEAGTLFYRFVLSAQPEAKLRHVRIEDISADERIHVLLDDAQPTLTNQRWSGQTEPLAAADPRLAWLYYVVPSLRVYRFTLTSESGKVTELHQIAAYPPFIKEAIRRQRGEKVP